MGDTTERRIWNSGIHDWNDFIDAKQVKGFSALRKNFYDKQLHHAKEEFIQGNPSFFQRFPQKECWRLYDHFKDECCFLDIETTGYYGDITVIGMYDGKDTKMMVKGFNLDKQRIADELKRYKMLVTFNGASFDLPVINRYFNGVIPQIPHLDLRFACARLGLAGGLKSIEKETGIKRAEEVADMSGEDAVYLWRQYRSTGNRKYLDKLVQYNEEDIVNLKPLADMVFTRLKQRMISNMNLTR